MAGIQELEDIYADPDNPGAIVPDLTAALQLYEESRGRAETVPDIFGGEELDTGVHAGAEGGKGDEVHRRPWRLGRTGWRAADSSGPNRLAARGLLESRV